MNIDKKLEALSNIRPADPPPFLLSRIQAQVHSLTSTPAPVQWKWTFVITALALLILNIGIVVKSASPQKPAELHNVINSMHLSSSNQLYDE
ncbi:MAG: hypothetical protein INR73_15370 [Williamsia sp.]|nr:hypothetical protein [Williamsia sp.]